MKKTLTILLVLLIASFAIFAVEIAEGNTIVLNSTIDPLTDYLFSLTETSSAPYNASVAGTATFEITSDHIMNFSTIPDSIDIAISVTPWVGSSLTESNPLFITSGTVVSTDSRAAANASNDGYVVNFTSGYNAPFDLGTFSVNWADKDTLAADTYTATVIIAYTQV